MGNSLPIKYWKKCYTLDIFACHVHSMSVCIFKFLIIV